MSTPREFVDIDSDDDYSDDGSPNNDDRKEERSFRAMIQKNVDRLTMGRSRPSAGKPKDTQDDMDFDAVSYLFPKRDFKSQMLKKDHIHRPLWIDPRSSTVTLESFSPLYKQAQAFLVNIAEPQSRPSYIHEYKITNHSLYAAVSVGLKAQDIINTLERFSKTAVPQAMIDDINFNTKSYGKVKLVLKQNRYFVESTDPNILQSLLRDQVIAQYRVNDSATGENGLVQEQAPKMGDLVIPGIKVVNGMTNSQPVVPMAPADGAFDAAAGGSDDEDDVEIAHSFQVGVNVEAVTKRCLEMGYPLLEEYDFRNDKHNRSLDFDLRPSAQIRPYQEACLSKMFGNGRAKSGIIVLPCGAGKTLVGITAACTIKKSVMVLCTSAMSVVQWKSEFLKWSNISPSSVATFTSDNKERFEGEAGIVVSTYSMVTNTRNRSHDSQKFMDFLTGREWGLLIMDEVHVVPALMFRKVLEHVKAHSKLGLTATLLREDDKIDHLNFLIGPKLYEANWMELAEEGYIARVQCAEVWCAMTTEFYTQYLQEKSRKQLLLYAMNPRKFQACQFLIDYHEKRGDKIIVFSDNVYTLKTYATKLKKFYIYGDTPQHERMRILENFQHNDQVNTLFLSKIGDTSLDLPEATCLIQISSHYGSRRQEAQRLGRILRAKRRNDEGFNAFFYSLVSKDTIEMFYSSKRQAFLVDQGYAFKVITHLEGIENLSDMAFTSPQERRELLNDVMMQNADIAGALETADDGYGGRGVMNKKRGAAFKRTAAKLSELSGGSDMAYIEYVLIIEFLGCRWLANVRLQI